MKAIEVARKVVETKGCHLFRAKKNAPGEYDAKPYFSGNKRGWVALDLFSASAVCTVYDKLSDENRAKYETMGAEPNGLVKMAKLAFKLIK